MRTMTEREARERWIGRAMQEGATYPHAREILRHARTLQRYAEQRCGCDGGSPGVTVYREDCANCGGAHTLYSYRCEGFVPRHGPCSADRTRYSEKRARERVEVIAAMFGAAVQFQGDPRGAVVQVCWPSYQRQYGAPPHDSGSGWEGVPS